MAGAMMARLRAVLGLDAREFEQGLKDQGRNVKKFGDDVHNSFAGHLSRVSGLGRAFVGGLAAGVVTSAFAGITGSVTDTIRSIAQLGDEAKRAGVPLKDFQEWKFVAEQNRIGVDQMVDGLKELNLRADEFAVTGSGPAAEAFQRLGFGAAQLKEKLKNPSDLMLEIIGRMERMDKAAQIRIADEIFGGSAGERFVELLGQGESGLRQTIARAHEVGAVLDSEMVNKAADLDRRFTELTARIGNVGKAVAVNVAGAASSAFTLLDDLGRKADMTLAKLDKVEQFRGRDAALDLADSPFQLTAEAEAIDDLGARYDTLVDRAVNASQVLGMLSFALPSEASSEVTELVDEMNSLVAAYRAGQIEGEQFSAGVQDINTRAETLIGTLGDIDGVDMSGAVSALGDLGRAVSTVLFFAQKLRAALPGAVPWTQPKGGLQPDLGRFPEPYKSDSPLAPKDSPRPKPAPAGIGGIDWGVEDEKGSKGGGGGGGGGGGKKRDEYAAEIAALKEETQALQAEAVAFAAVASSGRDYGDAIEYARKRAELLHKAQLSGKEITPELRAEVDQLAQAYVTAGLEAEAAAERLERLEENGKRGADALTDVFLSVMKGAEGGKAAVASLLAEMARVQMQRAMLNPAISNSGFGRFLGSMLTVGANANGTRDFSGGLTWVGERGRELVALPQGSQVYPHEVSEAMSGQGGGRMEIVPSPYFDVVVDGRVQRGIGHAAPAIHNASVNDALRGVGGAVQNIKTRGTR